MIQYSPKMANIENHPIMIGPKEFPTSRVPKCCTEKSNVRITSTIGTVSILGYILRRPSTADETEIGGVMIPSASRALPPIIAGTSSQREFLRTSA